ncbi:MAG: nicotinate-nucleotide--dimethylbenzimidazole phosphoribosyltransferase [Fibrobacteres bacterium]|nr:nicotinate-nucleotide--dimethylbenzimidazole phosphoribosyltransferase [Fibrobacterota bacterium]
MKFKVDSTVNKDLEAKVISNLNNLTKPLGSLGRMEEFALKYCLARGIERPKIEKMAVYTFAGDHGITDEKVAPYPKEVTPQMVLNMLNGGAAVSVMARGAGVADYVVDMGVDFDFQPHKQLLSCKVAKGTANFRRGAAMTVSQCEQAIEAGRKVAKEAEGDLFGIGEMGIGNTSSASALYALLLGLQPELTVGAGTGAAGDLLAHKSRIIAESVDMHRKEWDGTPFDALRRVGGYEIAGMTGFIIGAAEKRIPVAVDGFIASVAAAVAVKIAPELIDYLYFSHQSAEKFHRGYFEMNGIRPILQLDMRLGEGTGAVLAMQIISQAVKCYNEMASFASAGVSNKE